MTGAAATGGSMTGGSMTGFVSSAAGMVWTGTGIGAIDTRTTGAGVGVWIGVAGIGASGAFVRAAGAMWSTVARRARKDRGPSG
jgi:hypothetical protein